MFFFSLKCNKDDVLHFSYLGYIPIVFKTYNDTILTIKLHSKLVLKEVTVISSSKTTSSNAEIRLNNEQIKSTPTLLGEADLVKALQFTPGVVQNKEGTSGFSVRGGSNDQNLFMIDGVPVYNINHLMGFFSVFSADAVSNMTFYKSGVPARFGGRLSSVTDVRLKEGNDTNIKVIASIGLISSKFSLEGPMLNRNATFYISARRTYFDLFTKAVSMLTDNIIFSYYFNDFTLKTNYKLNDKNRIFLSFYGGNDMYNQTFSSKDELVKTTSKYQMGWVNIISSLRWNYLISKDVFSNATICPHTYVIR